MFSYIDLVRTEIGLEIGKRFAITISDMEMNVWRTLGDVVNSVVQHTNGEATEDMVCDWVRTLIAEGYGDSVMLAQNEEVFCDYDRMTSWFSAIPYPHSLGDRWFAK